MALAVLYVDDEAPLCRAFERALRAPDLCVVTTTSPDEALTMMVERDLDVIASDYRMPGINGLDLLRHALERVPDARRVLVSGCSDGEVDSRKLREAGVDTLLAKPWTIDNLRRVVRQAGDVARLARENSRLTAAFAEKERLVVRFEEERAANQLATLLAVLELRNADTSLHSGRVAGYAALLARRMGLSPEDTRIVERAALVHDIGRLGLPDGLLTRTDAFDQAEKKSFMQHATTGARVLERIGVDPRVCRIVLEHHERWDGSGYPMGLARDAASLGARIVAVCDAYDDMRSFHPYREGKPHEACLARLAEASGSQFDPAVVTILMGVPLAELDAVRLAVEDSAPAVEL